MALGSTLIMLVACAGPDRTADQAVAARAALDGYVLDFWVKRDTAALGRALSPAMVYHYNGKVVPGAPAAHLAALRAWGTAFPDLTASIDVFVVSGDTAAAATTWTGTHMGELCKRPGTGTKVSWVVNYVLRVEQGRIVELWEAWDEGGLNRTLGIDPTGCS